MSILNIIKLRLGLGPAAENHHWDGSVPNQLSLLRGTPEAPGTEVLKVVNGVLEPVQTGPAFSAYRTSSNQAIASDVQTKVLLNAKSYDTANCFDVSTGRFTPNVAGYYQINGCLAITGSSVDAYIVRLAKNTSAFADVTLQYAMLGALSGVSVSGLIYMNGTTDFIELYGQVNATANQAFLAGQAETNLSGFLARKA